MMSDPDDNEAEQPAAPEDPENRYVAIVEKANALYEAGDVDGAQALWAASEQLAEIVNGPLTDENTVGQSEARAELLALSALIAAGPIQVEHDALMLAYAIVFAHNGWEVFPLRGKAPAIRGAHPAGPRCKGECGRDGHGHLDATIDIRKICEWWTGKYRGANIGGRIPEGVFALDCDPRKTGHTAAMKRLVEQHGPLAPTLMTVSGRLDGGAHRFYWYIFGISNADGDGGLIRLGHAICDELEMGRSRESLHDYLSAKNWPASDASWLITASVASYCPYAG